MNSSIIRLFEKSGYTLRMAAIYVSFSGMIVLLTAMKIVAQPLRTDQTEVRGLMNGPI